VHQPRQAAHRLVINVEIDAGVFVGDFGQGGRAGGLGFSGKQGVAVGGAADHGCLSQRDGAIVEWATAVVNAPRK
jgi:hypothetical protein